MGFPAVLFQIDMAAENLIAHVTTDIDWCLVLSFNVPGHASTMEPDRTMQAPNLGLSACKVKQSSEFICTNLAQFILVHAMSKPQMVFQDRLSFIVLATMSAGIKQRFCVSSLNVSLQACLMKALITIGAYHFACNSLNLFSPTSNESFLQDSMKGPLVFLHVVGTLKHLVTLRTLGRLRVHMLHPNVPRQVNLCYQLAAMGTGFLACK